LSEVFKIAREAVIDEGAFSMKIGRNMPAILRPDKFVIYFKAFSLAIKFARKMARHLTSFRPQGVPFTCQVNPEYGLISIGIDPPRKISSQESWRSYVTEKLSMAVLSVHRSRPADPLKHIFNYMQAIGIDCRQWKPVHDHWYLTFDIHEQSEA